MKAIAIVVCALALLPFEAAAADSTANPKVVIDTNRGSITVELYEKQAPATVANFLKHVDAGFYSGLVFHRVIRDFMIQAGGFDAQMQKRTPLGTVQNESRNGLHNARGTIAMARLDDPNSATSQFFINLKDNASLDPLGARAGYTVFGHVVSGMSIVDSIATVSTGSRDGYDDVPLKPIVVQSIARAP